MTPMSQQEPFVLETREGHTLHGVVQWPEGTTGPCPTVIISHGFKGFLEWGFFPPLADLLVERGFTAVRFNYSGTGMRPGDDLVTDLEAFRTATFSKDVSELLQVLDAAGVSIAPDHIDRDRLALVGHSRGGGISTLASAAEPWNQRLKALVTWAGVSTFERYRDHEKPWRENGELVIQNGRTGQDLPMGVEILDDLDAHGQALDILAAAEHRTAPWLIVHGAADPTVPLHEAEALEKHGTGAVELLNIADADHVFGARHPFAGPTPHLIQAMNATQAWLKKYV